MEQIKKFLQDAGLTPTEITLYLTGLAYDSLGVSELVKQTGIQRTTVYHALDTLAQKGLVSKHETGQRLEFSMADPTVIEKVLNQQISVLQKNADSFKDVLPLFEKYDSGSESKIKTFQYDGIKGIKTVVEEALYCRSGQWDIIAPKKNFFADFDRQFASYFLKTRTARGITTRSLWEKGLNRHILSDEEIAQRNPRYVPAEMHGKFKSVIILFDDKVAFISSLKQKSAVLIQSEELFRTMTAMFESIWNKAKPYKN